MNCIHFLLNTQVNYYPINNVWNIWLKFSYVKVCAFYIKFYYVPIIDFYIVSFWPTKSFLHSYHSIVNFQNIGYKKFGSYLITLFLLVKGKKCLAFATLNNEHITSFHTGPLAPGCRSGWIHLSRRGHCSWPSRSAVSTQLSGLQSGYSQGSALTHTKCPHPALFCK